MLEFLRDYTDNREMQEPHTGPEGPLKAILVATLTVLVVAPICWLVISNQTDHQPFTAPEFRRQHRSTAAPAQQAVVEPQAVPLVVVNVDSSSSNSPPTYRSGYLDGYIDGLLTSTRNRTPLYNDYDSSGYSPASSAWELEDQGRYDPELGRVSSWVKAGRPLVAENGSTYGEISDTTFKPKTVFVPGYFRKDGTYVRSHFRSK